MPKPYNLFNWSVEDINSFLLTKASAWKYEKERRILLNTNNYNKNSIKFDKKILSKIIFGLNTEEEDKIEILEIIKKYYYADNLDVKIYQTKRIRHQYKLELLDFNL
jgi:hypothetical protein